MEDVVVTTSSGDMVVDCCITLVCAVDIPSTSDVVLANCDVETTDGAVVFSEEAIFPEVNAVPEEARSSGDVLLVVISSSNVPANGVVTFKEVVTFDGVVEVTLSVGINVDRTVLCVLEDFGLCI